MPRNVGSRIAPSPVSHQWLPNRRGGEGSRQAWSGFHDVHATSVPSAALGFPLGKAERPCVGCAVPTAMAPALRSLPPTPFAHWQERDAVVRAAPGEHGLGSEHGRRGRRDRRHAQPRTCKRPKGAFANLPPSVRVCSPRASARQGARHDGTRVWVLYFGVRTMPPSASTKPDPPVPVLYSCRGEGIVFRSFHFSLVGEW